MQLKGTAALVTGSSTGIGEAIAMALASQGARLGLVARRPDALATVAANCRDAGSPDVRTWSADLTDLDLAEKVAIEADDAFGGLGVLVNNAGIPKRVHAARLTFDQVTDTMQLNYYSPVRMMLALLPRLVKRGSGVIVNISSIAGRMGSPKEAAYSGSKFALNGFSEALHVDLDGTGVVVRVIAPGPIETRIWHDFPGNEPPFYTGPMYPPSDVAAAVVTAITGDVFEHFIPPDLAQVVAHKAQDVGVFLAGTAAYVRGGPLPEGGADRAPEWR